MSTMGASGLRQKGFQFDRNKKFERDKEFLPRNKASKDFLDHHFEDDPRETRTIGGGVPIRNRRFDK